MGYEEGGKTTLVAAVVRLQIEEVTESPGDEMSQKAKLHFVTTSRVSGNRRLVKVVGFVSTFGWESAERKAKAKYPHEEIEEVAEAPPFYRKRAP